MPTISRVKAQKQNNLILRKTELELELNSAVAELDKLQTSVINGSAKTESLVNQQVKVNTIRQTIDRIDFEFGELDSQIAAEREKELRKQVIAQIVGIDRKAEKAGKTFVEIYSDIENLSYGRFVQLSKLKFEIFALKQEFHNQLMVLFPNLQGLLSSHLPSLETSLDRLFVELRENGCFLHILRSSQLSLFANGYSEDHRILPDNPLADWIMLSIEQIERYEQKNASG